MAKRKKKKSKNMKKGIDPHAKKQKQAQAAQTQDEQPIDTAAPMTDGEPTKSLAQLRAKHALDAIQSDDMKDYDKYVSYVSALPATIIISGLGQAMAMLKAGKKPGHGILFNHMQDWLCSGWKHGPYSGDILPAIMAGTEDDYIRAQAEAMEYLEWLKKFAVAFLKDGDNASSGGDDEPTSS